MVNQAMRMILHKPYDTRISDMEEELGWLTFKEEFEFHTMVLLYKIDNPFRHWDFEVY